LTHRIALLPGDGAGQEVVPEAVKVLRATGADLTFEEFEVGGSRVLRGEPALPDEVFEQARQADSILFGAVGDPRVPDVGYPAQVLLKMRFELDLYANLRPARLYDERLSPLRDEAARRVDLLIVRENTEGVYVGAGGRFKRGWPEEVALQADLNTRLGVDRIIELAFDEAARDLCMVDKSNAMQHAGGLWQDAWRDAMTRHPTVPARHLYVDAAAM
jgi:3-isopropylmalate dehydrogenase